MTLRMTFERRGTCVAGERCPPPADPRLRKAARHRTGRPARSTEGALRTACPATVRSGRPHRPDRWWSSTRHPASPTTPPVRPLRSNSARTDHMCAKRAAYLPERRAPLLTVPTSPTSAVERRRHPLVRARHGLASAAGQRVVRRRSTSVSSAGSSSARTSRGTATSSMCRRRSTSDAPSSAVTRRCRAGVGVRAGQPCGRHDVGLGRQLLGQRSGGVRRAEHGDPGALVVGELPGGGRRDADGLGDEPSQRGQSDHDRHRDPDPGDPGGGLERGGQQRHVGADGHARRRDA